MCMLQVFADEGGPALLIPGFFFVGCFPPQPMQAGKRGFQFAMLLLVLLVWRLLRRRQLTSQSAVDRLRRLLLENLFLL